MNRALLNISDAENRFGSMNDDERCVWDPYKPVDVVRFSDVVFNGSFSDVGDEVWVERGAEFSPTCSSPRTRPGQFDCGWYLDQLWAQHPSTRVKDWFVQHMREVTWCFTRCEGTMDVLAETRRRAVAAPAEYPPSKVLSGHKARRAPPAALLPPPVDGATSCSPYTRWMRSMAAVAAAAAAAATAAAAAVEHEQQATEAAAYADDAERILGDVDTGSRAVTEKATAEVMKSMLTKKHAKAWDNWVQGFKSRHERAMAALDDDGPLIKELAPLRHPCLALGGSKGRCGHPVVCLGGP